MATKAPGWLKFVGIVGGVVVLLAVGVGVGSFFFVRSSLRQFEAADHSFDAVAEQFGEIAGYRPEPNGTIPAERLEAFLEVRDKIELRRERMDNALTLLSGGDSGGVLAKARGTVGLLRNLAWFHRERNEVLMEAGVGLGEYYYVYTLAYYSWLGKSPADGPSFKMVGESGYLLETVEDLEEPVVRNYREELARLSLNRLLLPVLRHQLADLSTHPDRSNLGAWEALLISEIAELEADSRRLPWEDGLPEILERSFVPYRERLSDSYSTMCNAIEIGLARRSPDLATHEVQPDTPRQASDTG